MYKKPKNLFCLPCDSECWKQNVPLECSFDFLIGNATRLPDRQTTNWRTMPFHFCCIPVVGTKEPCKLVELAESGSFTVRNGDFVFIPAGTTHRVSEIGAPAERICLWMHFNALTMGDVDLLRFFQLPMLTPAAEAGRFAELMRALIALPHNLNTVDSIRQQLIGNVFLAELVGLGSHREQAVSVSETAERMQKALAMLKEEARNVSNRELAAASCLSLSRFLELFRQLTGSSPQQYRENLRFRRACRLLLATDRPVSAIADELGYWDVYHFSRRFKQKSGLPPTEFRRRYRSDGNA